jgi:hypothetical protein
MQLPIFGAKALDFLSVPALGCALIARAGRRARGALLGAQSVGIPPKFGYLSLLESGKAEDDEQATDCDYRHGDWGFHAW